MIFFDLNNIPEELSAGAATVAAYLGRDVASAPCLHLKAVPSKQGFSVLLDHSDACITYTRPCEFFRGMGLLKEWILQEKTNAFQEEKPCFEHLTYMAD